MGHLKQLESSLQDVAEIAEIKMPEVYVIPTDEMNAFAAGFDPKQDAVVAATEGIIKRLEPDELKAVIGHEIGHIVHGDMVSGELRSVVARASCTIDSIVEVAFVVDVKRV